MVDYRGNISVMQMDDEQFAFANLLQDDIRQKFLQNHNKFTDLQLKVGQALMNENDVVVESPSGTGKILSFTLPMLNILHTSPTKWLEDQIGAIILTPLRNSVPKIAQVVAPYAKLLNYSIGSTIYDPEAKHDEALSIIFQKGCNILITTPYCFVKLLSLNQDRLVKMCKTIKIVIFNKADVFTDQAFHTIMVKILPLLPKDKRTGVFATMPMKEREEWIISELVSPMILRIKPIKHQGVLDVLASNEGVLVFDTDPVLASATNPEECMEEGCEAKILLQTSAVDLIEIKEKRKANMVELFDVIALHESEVGLILDKVVQENGILFRWLDTQGYLSSQTLPSDVSVHVEKSDAYTCSVIRVWHDDLRMAELEPLNGIPRLKVQITDVNMYNELLNVQNGGVERYAMVSVTRYNEHTWVTSYSCHRKVIFAANYI